MSLIEIVSMSLVFDQLVGYHWVELTRKVGNDSTKAPFIRSSHYHIGADCYQL